jgi:hypothetical protein
MKTIMKSIEQLQERMAASGIILEAISEAEKTVRGSVSLKDRELFQAVENALIERCGRDTDLAKSLVRLALYQLTTTEVRKLD